MRKVATLLVSASSLLALLVAAPAASAGDTQCVGMVTGMHDNVVVPPGQTCIVTAATVRGNVKALVNSRLRVTASTIGGSVEGDKANVVQVDASTVRENIIIKEAGPGPAVLPGFFTCAFGGPFTPCEALVFNSTVQYGNVELQKVQGTAWVANADLLSPIRGNVIVEETFSAPPEFMAITDTSVAQNMQAFKNKGPGNKQVSGNTVGENLQCFENDAPFFTFGNLARQVQGQCTAGPLPPGAFATSSAGPALLLG